MRSGNGKHRRPRQAPAIVVAAGVTGSALAIPLLGATSAGAAEAGTWDRVAECESGGAWSADLGNGYYGGLQFSQEKWERYGGASYAPRADLASRSQQIEVAEKVFKAEGPQAWPSCAVISGLAPGGGGHSGSGSGQGGVDAADPGADAGVDSRTPPTPPADSAKSEDPAQGAEPGQETPSADPSADPTRTPDPGTTPDAATPSGDATAPAEPTPGSSVSPSTGPDASTSPTAPDATPGTVDPSAPGSGKHRGEPAPENSLPVPDDSLERGAEAGRHASRDGGGKGQSAPEPGTYTVRPGDNLWHIADEAKVPGGWAALYEANKKSVGADPDLIKPGQHLDLSEDQESEKAEKKGEGKAGEKVAEEAEKGEK
ncbi:peptidoglycan-binding protein LysM [Streptomyces spiroverticillatus]|uniref:Peptidoglycan-binding protein LysM n=1 Tax=Streptomyces finlayi TaxID=67296 RepID=A0A919CF49_9ACTN|nr:transglycosylase family protein [Streptomyces finlayi]GHA41573.1 peptidoglycan-binding protein LysM [Streptomyces spiroverticillatus]GHD16548.1 peptidoglycan-binding protein LysM [Streptomyces finlayi]